MSRHRSGLLSGLIIGLFMALLCAAGWAAFAFYADRLPDVVRSYGDGIPLAAGLALATGLLVGAAICLIRPRSLVLAPLAALYGAAAVVAGVIAGIAAFPEYFAYTPASEPGTPPLPTLDTFLAALPGAAGAFWPQMYQSWQLPAVTAAAALPAFVLVLVRTLRLRKKARAAAAATEEPQEEEPEYRAPFEPLQAAKPATTPPPPSLFTPPDRDAT